MAGHDQRNGRLAALIGSGTPPAPLVQATGDLGRRLALAVHSIRFDANPEAEQPVVDLCRWLVQLDLALIAIDPRMASLAIPVALATGRDVMIVRRGEVTGGIVIATDLADRTYPVLAAGRRFARSTRTPAVALHNATPLPMAPPAMTAAGVVGAVPDRVVAIHEQRGLRIPARRFGLSAVLTRQASPSAAILTAAEDTGADVIVVGVRPSPSPGRRRVTGVPEHVATAAPQSVLVVPIGFVPTPST
jgi:nucleotide-binding universal stress UspA family protein